MAIRTLVASLRDNPVLRSRSVRNRGMGYRLLLFAILLISMGASTYLAASSGLVNRLLGGPTAVVSNSWFSADVYYVGVVVVGGVLLPATWLLVMRQGPTKSEQEELLLTLLTPQQVAAGWLLRPVVACAIVAVILVAPLLLLAVMLTVETGSSSQGYNELEDSLHALAWALGFLLFLQAAIAKGWLFECNRRWLVLVVAPFKALAQAGLVFLAAMVAFHVVLQRMLDWGQDWSVGLMLLATLAVFGCGAIGRSFWHAGHLLLSDANPDGAARADEQFRRKAAKSVPRGWKRGLRDLDEHCPGGWWLLAVNTAILAGVVGLVQFLSADLNEGVRTVQRVAVVHGAAFCLLTGWFLTRRRAVPVISARLDLSTLARVWPFLLPLVFSAGVLTFLAADFGEPWELILAGVVVFGLGIVDFALMLLVAALLIPKHWRGVMSAAVVVIVFVPLCLCVLSVFWRGVGPEEWPVVGAVLSINLWTVVAIAGMRPALQRLQELEVRDIPIGRLSTEMEPDSLLPIVPDVPPPPLNPE